MAKGMCEQALKFLSSSNCNRHRSTWGQYYKTFYVRNLRIFLLS